MAQACAESQQKAWQGLWDPGPVFTLCAAANFTFILKKKYK